jgi:hypothetical protein
MLSLQEGLQKIHKVNKPIPETPKSSVNEIQMNLEYECLNCSEGVSRMSSVCVYLNYLEYECLNYLACEFLSYLGYDY